jgi:hypothetical protein
MLQNKELVTATARGYIISWKKHSNSWYEIYKGIYNQDRFYKLDITVYYRDMIIMMIESFVMPELKYGSKDITPSTSGFDSIKDIRYIAKHSYGFYLPGISWGHEFYPFLSEYKRKIVFGDKEIKMDLFVSKEYYKNVTSHYSFTGKPINKD